MAVKATVLNIEPGWLMSPNARFLVSLYIAVSFCFDMAVRAVKLGFLQLIAPIPLIAKVDPKKGDEVFNKWVKECTSTYLNLFVRLVAIYFALYILFLVLYHHLYIYLFFSYCNLLSSFGDRGLFQPHFPSHFLFKSCTDLFCSVPGNRIDSVSFLVDVVTSF